MNILKKYKTTMVMVWMQHLSIFTSYTDIWDIHTYITIPSTELFPIYEWSKDCQLSVSFLSNTNGKDKAARL